VVHALLVVMGMKPSLRGIFIVTLAALGATACGGVALRVGDGGANGGQGGSGQGGTGQGGGGGSAPVCNGLDEATCTATPGCSAQHCQVCPGAAPTYAGCTTPGAPVACPAEACVQATCGSLDETSCKTRGDCSAQYCPDCTGGQAFAGCAGPGEGFACAAPYCPTPEPRPCNVTTEAACDAIAICHSVFVDKPICDCAVAGCCAVFSHCADGAKASCTGTSACQITAPYCEGPAYVVSYVASCYEGCVRPSECGP
jgi:hypothetical protein